MLGEGQLSIEARGDSGSEGTWLRHLFCSVATVLCPAFVQYHEDGTPCIISGDNFQAPTPNPMGFLCPALSLCIFRSVSVYISTGSSSVLPGEHQDQSDHSSSPKLPPCAERSCVLFAARPCGTAGKAAGGLPTLGAVPGKAGLSRLVRGPVIWAPLTAELMEPPKLRELASTSLLSSSREDLGFGLTAGCQGEVGDGAWSGNHICPLRLPSRRDV